MWYHDMEVSSNGGTPSSHPNFSIPILGPHEWIQIQSTQHYDSSALSCVFLGFSPSFEMSVTTFDLRRFRSWSSPTAVVEGDARCAGWWTSYIYLGPLFSSYIYTLRTQTLEICRVWLETSGMFDEMKIPRVSYANLGFSFSNPYWTRI